ncbi:MAG: ChaN family lipoprotein [Polyangia bacterium]
MRSTSVREIARRVRCQALAGLPLVLWLGCASSGTVRPSEAPAPPRPTATQPLPPGHPPISSPRDDGTALQLRDGATGAALGEEALRARIRSARAIYVGERHDSVASHRAQLAVVALAYSVDPSLGVGLEMLPQALQPQLDAYVVGSVDEDGFLRAVEWPKTWGFDFALYRPIFEFCRAHGVRLFALNAPRNLSRAVRQKGVTGLSAAEREALPAGYPWPAPTAHQAMLRAIWSAHAAQHGGAAGGSAHGAAAPVADAEREASFQRFYTAQLVWDEAMAQAVVTVLQGAAGAPQRLVVLAGTGHVGRHAVPERAARRGVTASLTLGPIEGDAAPPTGAESVDVGYRVPPEG